VASWAEAYLTKRALDYSRQAERRGKDPSAEDQRGTRQHSGDQQATNPRGDLTDLWTNQAVYGSEGDD
jgi:hypothetical protein